jgi:hypothetical protein
MQIEEGKEDVFRRSAFSPDRNRRGGEELERLVGF